MSFKGSRDTKNLTSTCCFLFLVSFYTFSLFHIRRINYPFLGDFFIFHWAKVTLLHPSLDTGNFLSFMLQFMLDNLSVFNLYSQSLLQGIRVKRHTWKAIPSAVIQGVPLFVKNLLFPGVHFSLFECQLAKT